LIIIYVLLKLSENILFYNFTDSLGCRNNYQPNFGSMENQGNLPNNIEKIKVDEHTIVVIKNKLYQ